MKFETYKTFIKQPKKKKLKIKRIRINLKKKTISVKLEFMDEIENK